MAFRYGALACPRCKSEFDDEIESIEGEPFDYLHCDCHSYPVVAGIPVLQRNALVDRASHLIRAGRPESAVTLLLNRSRRVYPGRELLGRVASNVRSLPGIAGRYLDACARFEAARDANTPETFTGLLDERVAGHFGDYLRYRTVEESFWNLHAFLGRIANREGPVLDFGGGWGHSSHVVHVTTGQQVWNAEIEFAPLYYQRQYFDADLGGIVVEPGSDLPFRRDTFGTVLDLDGFHYVPNKYSIASEYERVAHQDGQILLCHTHNRARTARGDPLSPEAYRECFSWPGRLVPEETCLQSFLDADDAFTLPEWSDETSQEVNLLFERNGPPDRRVPIRPHPLTEWDGPLVVNPLYDIATSNDDGVELSRSAVSDQFATEFAFSMEQTASSYIVDSEAPRRDLLFRGVLSPLPRSYSTERPL